MTNCPFCKLQQEPDRELTRHNNWWFSFTPIGPVNEGHTLLVPRRHVERLEQLNTNEWNSLFFSINRFLVGHYNIGINAGKLAGQTVFHLHIHIIPREAGDVESVKGGIVGALGEKMKGSKMSEYLATVKE